VAVGIEDESSLEVVCCILRDYLRVFVDTAKRSLVGRIVGSCSVVVVYFGTLRSHQHHHHS